MGELKSVDFTSKMSDFEIVNSEFTRCKCYMLATGDNVNGSDITLEAVKKAMDRGEFYNKPVVAHLYKDEQNGNYRVGGHDSKWVITNVKMELINECIPFGCIPESADVHLEEVLEADGLTTNTYLACEILLWTGRYDIMDASYSDDIYFNQSCEISINDYHYKENDVFAIDDFTFSALCLLNKSDDKEKNVRPCFPSCRVERLQKKFSLEECDKINKQFALLMEEIKNPFNDKENKEDINYEKGENVMIDKIIATLSAVKFTNQVGQNVDKYALLSVTDKTINVVDREDSYKAYSVNYAVVKEEGKEDELVIDFESKVEGKLVIAEKDENDTFSFDIYAEATNLAEAKVNEEVSKVSTELTGSFNEKYDTLKGQFELTLENYKKDSLELEKYRKKEADEKEESKKAEIDKVIEDFSAKMGNYPEFLVYRARIDEVYKNTVDEVRGTLTLMLGKYSMSTNKDNNKNFNYNPEAVFVNKTSNFGTVDNKASNKYGNLLDKYINR